jgi:hypothetical protein
VEDGAERAEAVVQVPFAYRDAVRALGPPRSARAQHVAVGLGDGRALLATGSANTGTFSWTAEVYDAATGTSAATGELRLGLAAQSGRLPDGRVLVAGGTDADGTRLDTVELWDRATRVFTPGPARLGAARALHTATPLADGRVLVVGGEDGAAALRQAEVYE